MDARTKVNLAIRQSCKEWPWLATLLLRVRPVEKTGINTFGADQRLKFYFDPDTIDQTEFNDLVYQIKKSVVHPVLRHNVRGSYIITDQQSQEAFATATEIAANQMFTADHQYIPDSAKTHLNTMSTDGNQLPVGLCVEEYFSMLLDDQDKPDPEDEDGDDERGDGDGTTDVPVGGSSQDGQPREWEDLPDEEGTMTSPEEGVSDEELDRIVQRLVETASDSMSRSGGGDFSIVADSVGTPKIRPEQLLRMAIAKSLDASRQGSTDPTYRRISRRHQESDVYLRPSYLDPKPKVTVVIDSSASMGTDDIELGSGIVDLALSGMDLESVRVVSGDTDIRNDQKDVRRIADLDIKGGGGTEMGQIVDKVLSEPDSQLPDLCILVTDGGTDWPEKHKVPFVACVTRGPEYVYGTPPSWMPLVHVA